MAKIKYIISSHKNYYSTTIGKLLHSLIQAKIPKSDIFVAVGGQDNNDFYDLNWIEHKNVTTNSFDLTSLIECVKHDLFPEYDYFFLLHDTCEVGENFKDKIENRIDENTITKALFATYPSSNIGLYKRDYIIDFIQHKIPNINIENQSKDFYVKHEDAFFVDKTKNAFSLLPIIEAYKYIYSDNVKREINVCPEIELIKYKANWFVRDWVIEA